MKGANANFGSMLWVLLALSVFFNLRVVFLIVKFVLHSEIATYVGDNKFILSVFLHLAILCNQEVGNWVASVVR